MTPVSRIFADNTDLSIDCFPLSEARPGADLAEHPPQPRPLRKGRVREARAGRRRPGWGPRVPRCLLPPQARTGKDPRLPAGTAPHLPRSHPSSSQTVPHNLTSVYQKQGLSWGCGTTTETQASQTLSQKPSWWGASALFPVNCTPKCTGGAEPAGWVYSPPRKAQVGTATLTPSLQAPVRGGLRL